MKLHKSSVDPGNGVHWYVKELGLEGNAQIVEYDIAKEAKEHEKPEYLKINPFGM